MVGRVDRRGSLCATASLRRPFAYGFGLYACDRIRTVQDVNRNREELLSGDVQTTPPQRGDHARDNEVGGISVLPREDVVNRVLVETGLAGETQARPPNLGQSRTQSYRHSSNNTDQSETVKSDTAVILDVAVRL